MNQKRNLGLSILSGLLLWLAWPMQSFTSLIFIAFIPLLFLVDDISNQLKSNKKIFLFSFLCFLTWNLLSSYWIWNASALGMIVAVLLNATMMSLVILTYHIIQKKNSQTIAGIALITVWISMEYLHHHWDFAWPWLSLGNVFSERVEWVQWYEYTGIFGGTVWVLAVNLILFNLIKSHTESNFVFQIKRYLPALALIIMPIIISKIIYQNYTEAINPCQVVIVQPNIDPYNEKFSDGTADQQFNKLIKISDSLGVKNTEFFIWPETSVPMSISEDQLEQDLYVSKSRDFLTKYKNASLLIGTTTYKTYTTNETVTARKFRNGECCYDVFNSALLIENNTKIQLYHKSKLVSGVEQMPYPSVFRILEPLAINLGGSVGSLGKQKNRTVFYSESGIGAAPVICYESVFGEFVNEYIFNGAQFIAIITNDGWWGNTAGHKQHASIARLRAIETRRSIARSANTGISCTINQRGDVLNSTKYWTPDGIRTEINLNSYITFYVKNGDYIAKISLIISLLIVALSIVRRK